MQAIAPKRDVVSHTRSRLRENHCSQRSTSLLLFMADRSPMVGSIKGNKKAWEQYTLAAHPAAAKDPHLSGKTAVAFTTGHCPLHILNRDECISSTTALHDLPSQRSRRSDHIEVANYHHTFDGLPFPDFRHPRWHALKGISRLSVVTIRPFACNKIISKKKLCGPPRLT